ncbi:SapC family protein [Marinimicrobium sp. ABcell2]|uniref:SapC family protein n=1 Tax=Marinimicrobium sp. ABcell2 TaxID=3069751 RepID=UPI0027B267BA|nr:SapC family protein [Marinimicrobium sp. ABcell2]MDQ2075877.1 SapC family protein [Marinimicrobium sp. ABcell2]
MANHVLLNSVEHKNLRIITERGEKYGDDTWYALTFPSEFRTAQMCYPIFFQQTPESGQFIAVTLFGFEQGENLFLNGNTWDAPYIPMTILRKPFLIGKQRVAQEGMDAIQRVIHIDMDDPRVSDTEGELLFGEYGGNTPYLDRVATILETIHTGLDEMDAFIEALVEFELLEPFTLEVTLVDETTHQLVGFHTINEDKLRALDDAAIADLHKRRFLEPIYMQLASQSHINYLVTEKNKRLMK